MTNFDKAYQSLNSAQKQAVDTIEGPVLVLAGPGTGKTQVLTLRIANILKNTDTEPSSVLALTFTESATKEMRQRLIKLIGKDGYRVQITTFHGFCNDVIASNPERFSKPAGMKNVTDLEKIQIIKEILEGGGYEYLKPVNDPLYYASYIISSLSTLKREGFTVHRFSELVSIFKDEFEIQKDNLSKTAYLEKEKQLGKNLDLLDLYEKYQIKLAENGHFDFDDMINWVVESFENDNDFLLGYQEESQYLLVDEYQDTNSSQNRLLFALSSFWGEEANLFVVGDANQCLPGNTLIETSGGAKEIKNIRKGDLVLSAVGKGYTSYVEVTNTFKQDKKSKQLTFTTKSGKRITVTDNHKMFCFIPPREITKYWYNYLMFKDGVGWRLGITRSLSVRLKTECGADKIIGIAHHNTESDARCAETIFSLRYQIPTIVFQARNGVVSKDYINKVFSEFDTYKNAQRLANDLGINLNEPHYMREATTLGKGRVKINLMMCSRSYRSKYNKVGLLDHPEVLHEINIQTSNDYVLKKIKSLGFKLRNKNIGKGFRISSVDIKYLYKIAEKLERELPGFIDIKASIGTSEVQHKPARIMQAGNVLVGSYLPVLNGKEIKYEEIISRTEEIKREKVYDLEVTPSHNFIANGIVVHNSIYRFQGASKENLVQFKKAFPGHVQIVLNQNYRSTKNLLHSSASLIGEEALKDNVNYKNQKIKIAKFSSSLFEDEFVLQTIQKKIASGQNPSDIAVIVKENKDIENLVNLFKQKNIPFRLEAGSNVLDTPYVSQFLKLLKVITSLQDNLDDLDLFTILNYPYFHLESLQVLQLSRQAYTSRCSLINALVMPDLIRHPEEYQSIQKVITQFITWNSLSATKSLPEIFQIIFQDSGLLNHLLSLPQPMVELNRFSTLFDDLKNQSSADPDLNLKKYLQNLQIMQENHIKLGEKVLQGTESAVTLTTAHKSKGLEWSTVFVYRFADTHWGNKTRREMIKLPPGIIVFENVDLEEDLNSEEHRLFYVALTRAKEEVFLTGAVEYDNSAKMTFPSIFLEDLPKEYLEELDVSQFEKSSQQTLVDLLSPPSTQTLEEDESAYLQEILRDFRLSPTALNTYLQCHYKFKLDNLYRIPRAKAPAMCFGTAVHAALEKMPCPKKQFLATFESALQKEILTQNQFQDRLRHGQKVLSLYYDQYQDQFGNSLYKEKSFGTSAPIFLDDIALTGKADRIDLISPPSLRRENATKQSHSTNSVRFVDYKTGKPKSRNEIEGNTQNSNGDYKRQLVFYKLLSELDNSFPYTVSETEIDFVEPDPKGQFKKENFSISSEEVSALKTLIQTSVKSIRSLDFSRTLDNTTCQNCPFLSHCWPNQVL